MAWRSFCATATRRLLPLLVSRRLAKPRSKSRVGLRQRWARTAVVGAADGGRPVLDLTLTKEQAQSVVPVLLTTAPADAKVRQVLDQIATALEVVQAADAEAGDHNTITIEVRG